MAGRIAGNETKQRSHQVQVQVGWSVGSMVGELVWLVASVLLAATVVSGWAGERCD